MGALSPVAVPLAFPAPLSRPDPRRWLGLLALSISVLTVIMTSTSVNLALPAISNSFGVSVSNLTWVLDAYTLAMGALTLPGGVLGDIFGRRRVYLVGLALFSLGAVCASVAPNLALLIAARVTMGVGAAMVMPGTLSLISAMFQGRERATAIGLWGGMNGIGLALGPLVGGVLVEYVGWRAVFWTNVPLVLAALLMVPRFVPKVAPRTLLRHFDLKGSLTVTVALSSLIVGLIQGQTWGWGAPATVGCFVLAAALLGWFVRIEHQAANPMLPLRLYRSRTFCAANVSAVVLMLGVLSAFFFLSLFLQEILGYSGVRAGLAYLPMAVFMAGLAPLAGRFSARFGPRLPIVVGLGGSTLGIFWMSLAGDRAGLESLVGGLMLIGIGMGLASPAISNAAVSSVSASLAGAASGMNAMARQVGGAIGIALLTAIFAGRFQSHLTAALAGGHLSSGDKARVGTAAANIANGIGGGNGGAQATRIHDLIQVAFTQGMTDTLRVFAIVSALGVAVALFIRRSDFTAARASSAAPFAPANSGSASASGGMAEAVAR
jgi:EmrB/QacA subfamily drug resistance transporter